MAKRRSPNQLPLEKRDIPKMPEGYYSSGPNPNLRHFVEQHSTPYDVDADDYVRSAFDETIVDISDATIFNMHPYWSKKPHGAISQYIQHFTNKDSLVLDPFLGSGGTVAVASQLGRPSIGIDLSPAATFIAKHMCTPANIGELDKLYQELTEQLAKVREHLYYTRCNKCNGRAEVQYLVWSQRYRCDKCLQIITHYQAKNGKCPHCGEKISTRQERHGYVPVSANIKCLEGCSPARFDRAIDSSDPDYVEAFQEFDLAKLNEVDNSQIPYWYPTDPFPREWVSWRPNLAEIGNVSGFFTKRNLWAAAAIVDWIDKHNDNPLVSWLMFTFTASVMSISKKAQHLEEGGGYIPGNYVFPPQIKERNVFNTYESLYSKMLKGVEEVDKKSQTTSILLSTQSALDLIDIPSNTVDYIFTDPPYSDKVPFGEFNFLWEVWLRAGLSWEKDEILVNPKIGKDMSIWKDMMRDAVNEMYRILKPGRWISVCYHDSAEGSWMHLQDVFAEVGFISEDADQVLSIERNRKSWKQATTSRVQKRDLVINFRKPTSEDGVGIQILGNEDDSSFLEKASRILVNSLTSYPGSARDRLYDELVSRMVRRGEFERHNFDELLRSIAEESNGRWYLLETADQIDEAESRKEDAAATRLETFMTKTIDPKQGITGVHYSDLFEQYLPVKDKPRRELRDWLREYFYETDEGTWRLPNDNEERESKQKLRQSGLLRRVKRFANALIEGVPPAQRDQPERVATAAEWLRQCRRAGLYDQGRAIWEKGGFNWNTLPETQYIEVEEDYQRCVRRGNLR